MLAKTPLASDDRGIESRHPPKNRRVRARDTGKLCVGMVFIVTGARLKPGLVDESRIREPSYHVTIRRRPPILARGDQPQSWSQRAVARPRLIAAFLE